MLDAVKHFILNNGNLEDYSIQTLYDRAFSHCIAEFGSTAIIHFWPNPISVKRFIKRVRLDARGPIENDITMENKSTF